MSKQLIRVLGEEKFAKIQNSKILLVGAGGIGCELLKNLILTGYGEIHIVDLDTIDLSNLNRQFLFRLKDIKKFKSTTAADAVQSFNFQHSTLVAHTGNIMDTGLFPISWFDQFDFILNALDNLQARSYINKITQFLQKPLMESGTSGFDGYIQPMVPLKTECFGCTTKETPKTFPVCTIRSTPSQPIHCIVWAKNFLFQQLFNKESIQEEDTNADLGTTDKQEIERIKKESNELKELTESLQTDIKDAPKVIDHILTKIFRDDIEKLLLIDTLWQTRAKPTPLSKQVINAEIALLNDTKQHGLSLNDVWEIKSNVKCFVHAAYRLMERFQDPGCVTIDFDKDDQDTLEFVSAAANIRSYIFNIPIKSVFDIKQIAGNIIPAIATTNAIIAGLSSLSSLNFLQDPKNIDTKTLTMAFTAKASKISTNKYLTNPFVSTPNPKCPVCAKVVRGICKLPKDTTIQNLLDKLFSQYGFKEDLSILDMTKGRLLYDIDFDDLAESSLYKLLHNEDSSEAKILYITDEEGDDEGMFLKPMELYLEFFADDAENTTLELPILEIPLVRPEVPEPEADTSEPTDAAAGNDANDIGLQIGDNGEIILDDDEVEENDGAVQSENVVSELSLKKHDLEDKISDGDAAASKKLKQDGPEEDDDDDDLIILD